MKDEIDQQLVERIRECAEMAGSGAELARLSGIPRRTLENYLSGTSSPKAGAVGAIAVAVGVSLDWLILGEGSKKRGYEGGFTLQSHDAQRFGAVMEAVANAYAAEGSQADGLARGREALRIYEKIWDLEDDVEFGNAMLIFINEMRRKLANVAGPSMGL